MLGQLKTRGLAVVLLACLAAACDSETPAGPTTPPPTTTTPFTGMVNQNGARTHTFSTAAGGTVTATLVSVGGEGQVVGFALGNWFGSFCSVVLANDEASAGAVLSGNLTSGATTLCVRVYDVGRIEGDPVSYSVEVVHP